VMKNRALSLWTSVLAVTLSLAPVVAAQKASAGPERFTASAIDPNRGQAGNVEIRVDRWSSDAERDRLMGVLLDKGADKLLDVLQSTKPVGSIQAPGSLAYDLHYARRSPLAEGGERIVLVTDRRLGFWELSNNTRSVDYPFTLIELRLGRDGSGQGKMSLATKIIADKDKASVILENWDLQPVLLTNVMRTSATH